MSTKRWAAHKGRLHSRTAILMPPPHVREQVPKGLQTPHAPSTGVASCSLAIHRPCLQCCSERDTEETEVSGIMGPTLGAEGENKVYECNRVRLRKAENRQSEHMKSYPWNWQHIYLFSCALMLIWEKLYNEVSGGEKKKISWLGVAGQKTQKHQAQIQ